MLPLCSVVVFIYFTFIKWVIKTSKDTIFVVSLLVLMRKRVGCLLERRLIFFVGKLLHHVGTQAHGVETTIVVERLHRHLASEVREE